MKKLMIPLLALAFSAGSHHLKADCPTPFPGPTGPSGALSDRYVSSFTEPSSQVLDANGEVVLVRFPENFVGPEGIRHPNPSHFIVTKAGTYLVSWMLNASYNFITNEAPNIFLFLKVDGNYVLANQNAVSNSTIEDFGPASLLFNVTNLSGQMLLDLAAGANLSMTIKADFDDTDLNVVAIDNALFTVVEIEPAP
jgi:hypothetical protein